MTDVPKSSEIDEPKSPPKSEEPIIMSERQVELACKSVGQLLHQEYAYFNEEIQQYLRGCVMEGYRLGLEAQKSRADALEKRIEAAKADLTQIREGFKQIDRQGLDGSSIIGLANINLALTRLEISVGKMLRAR